jgi:chaperone required for assembly of F1-ATPase
MSTERESPLDAARRMASPARQRRFYREATIGEHAGLHALHLDGKPARTPGRKPLAVTHAGLAEAIRAEWQGQGEYLDVATMPATRLANTAIDGVAPNMQAVRDEVAAYGGTDLLCYRAAEPETLVAREREIWDPILQAAERRFGCRFVLAEGIVHVAQPDNTLAALRKAVEPYDDPFRLTALHVATALTGSALIALLLGEGLIDEGTAWAAAHVDEDFQISRWGEDFEAQARRGKRHAEFRAAALVLAPGHPEMGLAE